MLCNQNWITHLASCLAPLVITLGAAGCGDDSSAGEPCADEDCSGHGTCAVVAGAAVCTCETGYDGATCGSCSAGYTEDGSGICVLSASCATDDPCGDHGTCDDTTGELLCTCDTGYDGQLCGLCYPGYHDDGGGDCVIDIVCMPNSCAGHGTCDDSSGVVECACDTGYAGSNCETCAADYHRDGEDNCVADEDCGVSDPCGDHGTCDDTNGVIACVCDVGWEGTVCNACYPGYHDDGSGACVLDEQCMLNTCDAHGTCDATGGTVECVCDVGYVGDHCEDCDADYYRDENENCVGNEDCSTSDPCGDYGACVDTTGVIECVCDMGYDGQFCGSCYAGYHDDGSGVCVLDEQCLVNTCSGRGTCAATGGVVSCSCDVGYDGAWCDSCDVDYHRDASNNCVADEDCTVSDPCGSYGTCVDTTGVIECVCDSGYDGQFCSTCYAGYHDEGAGVCVLDEQCLANTCSAHGTCDDAGGVVSCVCDSGYTGSNCQSCDVDFHRDLNNNCVADEDCTASDPCGAHGTCDDNTGVIECVCDSGYTGQFCDNCYPGYHDDGASNCVLDEQCLTETCSGHGACDDAGGVVSCICDAGYTGSNCQTCDMGYHLEAGGLCVINEDCTAADPCGAHGICVDTTGVIECVCDSGYDGTLCDACYPGYHDDGGGVCVLDEQCLPNTCSGHGACDATGGVVSCTCDLGYAGTNCQTCDTDYHLDSGLCVVDEDCTATDPCGDHGTCVDTTGVIECVCDIGYAGTNCDACYPGYEVHAITGLCEVPCPDPTDFRCSGQCTDDQDPQNCGACGNDCGGLQCLMNGDEYYCGCPTSWPWDDCSGQCIDRTVDENNCGACGNVCDTAAGEVCFDGQCVLEDTDCGGCPDEPEEMLCCDGMCMDLWNIRQDPNNCGSCGNVCTMGVELCVMGTCQAGDGTCGGTCDPNWQICCNGGCMDSNTFEWDQNNCGSCGNVCDASSSCDQGHCVCNPGTSDCGSGCVDILEDEANCGICGRACGAGEACVYGICEPEDPTACGGACDVDEFCCTLTAAPFEECVNVQGMSYDANHCGGCDPCGEGETCDSGTCNCSFMYPGYCSGVCTDFESPSDCGGCGIQCALNEQCQEMGMGGPQCVCPGEQCGGVCTLTMTNEQNCGGCGNVCNAGEACAGGHCVVETGTTCGPDCADQGACCDMGGWDQCLDWQQLSSDINHCGGCGIECTGGDVCVDGICAPPPGDDCTAPQVTEEGGWGYNLCENTSSGFVSANCMTPADGTQVDRFHLFTIPYDSPGGWGIDFMPMGLSMPQAEVWVGVSGNYCDNTSAPVGCIDPMGQIMLDSMMYPAGTEIVIFVYNASGGCDMGDYHLQIYPM